MRMCVSRMPSIVSMHGSIDHEVTASCGHVWIFTLGWAYGWMWHVPFCRAVCLILTKRSKACGSFAAGRSSAQLYEGTDFAPKFRAPVRALKEPMRGRGGGESSGVRHPTTFPMLRTPCRAKSRWIFVIGNPSSDVGRWTPTAA